LHVGFVNATDPFNVDPSRKSFYLNFQYNTRALYSNTPPPGAIFEQNTRGLYSGEDGSFAQGAFDRLIPKPTDVAKPPMWQYPMHPDTLENLMSHFALSTEFSGGHVP
jgi:hypothetical protein